MSCSFLPPIPIPSEIKRGYAGHGAIAANVDGALVASVDSKKHCVYIFNAADRTADAIIVGTAGTAGAAYGQLHSPVSACFVHRDGVYTLLICDHSNDRVVEVTARGEFMRAIAVEGRPYGMAERDGVIAVSMWAAAHVVVLLQHESGAVKTEVTIGSGTSRRADGQLWCPAGIAFTTDGRYILVADYLNNRVSKFSAASGAFVAHVGLNGISNPSDVLQCEDGSIVVAHGDGVARVGNAGVTVQNIIISGIPWSLSNSPPLNGIIVKCYDGSVFVLRDAWSHSLRCEWVQACARVCPK
jgi:DNA-binding beta-propeller fold protein YncE